LRRACASRRVVGADVVELAPAEGPESCAFAAAKLTYALIGYATADDPIADDAEGQDDAEQ
jgi:agmatinase